MNCYIVESDEGRSYPFPVSHEGLEGAITECTGKPNGKVYRVRPSEVNEIVWENR